MEAMNSLAGPGFDIKQEYSEDDESHGLLNQLVNGLKSTPKRNDSYHPKADAVLQVEDEDFEAQDKTVYLTEDKDALKSLLNNTFSNEFEIVYTKTESCDLHTEIDLKNEFGASQQSLGVSSTGLARTQTEIDPVAASAGLGGVYNSDVFNNKSGVVSKCAGSEGCDASRVLINEPNNYPFKCELCGRQLVSKRSLASHMKVHTERKLHECDVCLKKLTRASDLKKHKLLHTGIKPYECDLCRKKFSRPDSLRMHVLRHSGEKAYSCDYCPKKFTGRSQLKEHITVHTGQKPHECDLCHKRFCVSGRLKKHMLSHAEVRPFECDVCQQKFSRDDFLRNHMAVHTDLKAHECSICTRKFKRASDVPQHMRIHSAERSHECGVCHRKFTYSTGLKVHMLIHTGLKPYECGICQKKFRYNADLKNHMWKHYDEEFEENDRQKV